MELLSFQTGEYYARCHYSWIEKTEQFARIKETLWLRLPSIVRKVLQESCSPQIQILTVGSGDGVLDLEVLQIIQEELERDLKHRDTRIFIRAIEPNRHYISLYKKAIENLPESMKRNTAFDVRAQTFEEYTQEESGKKHSTTKFDIIHFNHSIYFVNPERTLKHCFQKELQEKGIVIVVAAGRDLITLTLDQASAELPIGKPQNSFADEVIDIIQKNGWKYEKFSQEYDIDVTEVFAENSTQGNLLLDFLTQYVNFRGTADQARINKVLSAILDHTIVRDGKRLGKKIDVLLVISK